VIDRNRPGAEYEFPLRLRLVDLVAPEFLVGVDLGPTFHAIVSFLRVSELESSWDDTGVVYSGKAVFSGKGSASPEPQHSRPARNMLPVAIAWAMSPTQIAALYSQIF
jgi:hypothetical protein